MGKISNKKQSFKDKDLVEKKVVQLSKKKGHWIEICTDEIKLSNKAKAVREYVNHPGAALIIPELPNGNLLFVKQYRYALKKIFLEFPAGKKDHKEKSLTTAKRELREEVGYQAKKMKFMTTIHPVIGYANETIDIYLAHDLKFVGAQPDEGEFLIPTEISLSDAMELVWDHQITDVKTQIALFWYARHLYQGKNHSKFKKIFL